MGKNSNVNKKKATLELDLQQGREEDAKRLARRAKKELKLGMAVESAVDDQSEDGGVDGALAGVAQARTKKFGKIKRKKKIALPGGRPTLPGASKLSRGIKKKPSGLMRKTLKKLAKREQMQL